MNKESAFSYSEELAIGVLYKKYEELRGDPLDALCYKHGISIKRDHKNYPLTAYLPRQNGAYYNEIILPHDSLSEELDYFLACHELSHYFLIKEIRYTPRALLQLEGDAYWRVEVLCDNFALAMTFAAVSYGYWSIGYEDGAKIFFQQGMEYAGKRWENDLFLASRILIFCCENITKSPPICKREKVCKLIRLAHIISS